MTLTRSSATRDRVLRDLPGVLVAEGAREEEVERAIEKEAETAVVGQAAQAPAVRKPVGRDPILE